MVEIDAANVTEFGIEGPVVNIYDDKKPYPVEASAYIFNDDKRLVFTSAGTCISASFTYNDIDKALQYSKAANIKVGKEVLVVVKDSKQRKIIKAYITKVENYLDRFCLTPTKLEDDNMEDLF